MGNSSSRNDHLPIPPGFMPPNYSGYPQPAKSSTWNPFKRNKMKKREKALREYLYTTPMILQYPNAFTGTLIHQCYRRIRAIHTYVAHSHPTWTQSCAARDASDSKCYASSHQWI